MLLFSRYDTFDVNSIYVQYHFTYLPLQYISFQNLFKNQTQIIYKVYALKNKVNNFYRF